MARETPYLRRTETHKMLSIQLKCEWAFEIKETDIPNQ